MKIFFILLVLFFQACSTKSVFSVSDKNDLDNVVQYCGGKQWGYVNKIKALDYDLRSKSNQYIYTAAIIESFVPGHANKIIFNFLIQSKVDLKIKFQSDLLQVFVDDINLKTKPSVFFVRPLEKSITQLYRQSDYIIKSVDKSKNSWEVTEKIIGDFWTKKPFYVQISSFPEKVFNPLSELKFSLNETNTNEVYVYTQVEVPLTKVGANSVVKVIFPEYSFNNTTVKPKEYVYNYDQNKLKTAIALNEMRCVSFEEMIRFKSFNNSLNPFNLIFGVFNPKIKSD